MIKLLLILTLISTNLLSKEIYFIFDFDDTIKITNVQNKGKALYNALYTQNIFYYNKEMLESIGEISEGYFILTNSPTLFKTNIDKLITKHSLNPLEISLRKLKQDSKSFEYKYEYIKSKIEKYPNAKFVLVGDNVGQDEEVYKDILKNYNNSIQAIYIHQVLKKQNFLNHPKVNYYYTAIEIIILNFKLFKEKNLNIELNITKYLENLDLPKAIPNFAKCPNQKDFLEKYEIKSSNLLKIQESIVKYCQNSKKVKM